MLRSLPPEIFDLITKYLCDYPAALKACCLVSKSWVPRIQKHLFAHIYFGDGESSVDSWTKAFPDPSNSPAHHTRFIWISDTLSDESTWVRSFCHIEALAIHAYQLADTIDTSLIHLHGLSPTLRSLQLAHHSISEAFDLIYSFPLLEDLTLRCWPENDAEGDEWVAPSTSPKFTGTLHLVDHVRSIARRLLALPDGPHFTKIVIQCPGKDAGSTKDLVLRCSDTLESLLVDHTFSSTFPPFPGVCQCLTAGA